MPGEARGRELEWLADEQRLVTLPAFRLVIRTGRGDAIDRIAVRTDDVQHIGHIAGVGAQTPAFKGAARPSFEQPLERALELLL
jgi:hypothetical protein